MKISRRIGTGWIAILAIVIQVLAFAEHGPLQAAPAEGGGVWLCTADGIRLVGGNPSEDPPAAPRKHGCDLCLGLAAPSTSPPSEICVDQPLIVSAQPPGAITDAIPDRRNELPFLARAPPLSEFSRTI